MDERATPEQEQEGSVDLAARALATGGSGPVWTAASDDLNVNLIVLTHGAGIDEHVNTEVDALAVGVAGEGRITIDGRSLELGPGVLVMIPKGAARSISPLSDRFAYLTCHRRRGGINPRPPIARC
jgi:quercetin dioxygenase-like cupin family protein